MIPWPWKRGDRDLEQRIADLEQRNLRILAMMENISQIVGIPRESMELQTAIMDLKGHLPADRGDQPYHW